MRFAAIACAALFAGGTEPAKFAADYAAAVTSVNAKHARAPGTTREDEFAANFTLAGKSALDQLLALSTGEGLEDALVRAAGAACDLDLELDFERLRRRVAEIAPQRSTEVGVLVSRERFVVRGVGGLEPQSVEHFADVFESVLAAYDEVFGFAEFSKLPGKKLRVRLHLEPQIEKPPHFAPQFPFHSEIDFPVADASAFTSPTPDGKFLFYGLCHELGHVVAMWGDASNDEDHHAWAHYTGVAIVEHMAQDPARAKLLEGLRDVKWRSLAKEREAAASVAPSLESREGVLSLLIALHDAVGPKALGAALNALDAKGKSLRINRVRYYGFDELHGQLLDDAGEAAAKKRLRELWPKSK